MKAAKPKAKAAIRVFLEGGGKGDGRRELAMAMGRFLRRAVPTLPADFAVFACTDGGKTVEKFLDESELPGAGNLVLLVDSEAPVRGTAADHVRSRHPNQTSGRSKLNAADVHLMIQCMESWLLSDAAALEACFGPKARACASGEPESLSADACKDRLTKAINAGRKREDRRVEYHEIDHGAKLLEKLSAARVREQFKSAKVLFERLEQLAAA